MAIIEVGEETAAAAGLRAWLSLGLSTASSLVSLLLGHRPSTQEIRNQIGPFVNLLAGPVHAIDRIGHITLTLSQNTYNALTRAKGYVLLQVRNEAAARERAYLGAIRYAQDIGRGAVAQAKTMVRDEATIRGRQVGDAVNRANLQAAQGRALSRQLVDGEAAVRGKQIGDAVNRADLQAAQGRQLSRDLTASEAHTRASEDVRTLGDAQRYAADIGRGAELHASQALTAATQTIDHQVTEPTRASWPHVTADLTGAAAVFGTGQAAITALIKDVPTTAPANLAEAAAGQAAITRVLTKTMEDCVAPNCRNTSQFGRDLQDLLGLAEGAAFLAFLEEMVRDPVGLANKVYDVAGPIVTATQDTLTKVLGV